MGWSSWNNFRVNINEQMIKEQADAMISSGLYDVGYRFINIDDGYFGGRDADGRLLVNDTKFSSGMKSLVEYGKNTCGSIPILFLYSPGVRYTLLEINFAPVTS